MMSLSQCHCHCRQRQPSSCRSSRNRHWTVTQMTALSALMSDSTAGVLSVPQPRPSPLPSCSPKPASYTDITEHSAVKNTDQYTV